jgi:hypothetical protein
MLDATEALFFSCRDEFAITQKRRCGVMVVTRDSEYLHVYSAAAHTRVCRSEESKESNAIG